MISNESYVTNVLILINCWKRHQESMESLYYVLRQVVGTKNKPKRQSLTTIGVYGAKGPNNDDIINTKTATFIHQMSGGKHII